MKYKRLYLAIAINFIHMYSYGQDSTALRKGRHFLCGLDINYSFEPSPGSRMAALFNITINKKHKQIFSIGPSYNYAVRENYGVQAGYKYFPLKHFRKRLNFFGEYDFNYFQFEYSNPSYVNKVRHYYYQNFIGLGYRLNIASLLYLDNIFSCGVTREVRIYDYYSDKRLNSVFFIGVGIGFNFK